jgi:hypothetical protein
LHASLHVLLADYYKQFDLWDQCASITVGQQLKLEAYI